MDRADADPARTKRADNRMVWTLGQGDFGAQLAGGLLGGLAQPRGTGSGWPNRPAVCSAGTGPVGQAARRTAEQTLPPTTGPSGLDTQARHEREATAGNPGGARPDGGSRDQARAR